MTEADAYAYAEAVGIEHAETGHGYAPPFSAALEDLNEPYISAYWHTIAYAMNAMADHK